LANGIIQPLKPDEENYEIQKPPRGKSSGGGFGESFTGINPLLVKTKDLIKLRFFRLKLIMQPFRESIIGYTYSFAWVFGNPRSFHSDKDINQCEKTKNKTLNSNA